MHHALYSPRIEEFRDADRLPQAGDVVRAPKRIRTSDLPLRRRTLYPAELSGRLFETLDELETLARLETVGRHEKTHPQVRGLVNRAAVNAHGAIAETHDQLAFDEPLHRDLVANQIVGR